MNIFKNVPFAAVALFLLGICGTPAATVKFAGVINDDAGAEISEWKTAGTTKTLDADGDNTYGTVAHLFYKVIFKGQNTLYTFNSSNNQVGPFAGYATVDHPDGVSADTQVRTTTSGNIGAGVQDHVMFTFTAIAGSPENVRIGIATDGLDGAQFSPATIGLRQIGGSSAEHTLTSVNSTIDMVFFDVVGVAGGDQFQIFADTGTGGFATHSIVTWDDLGSLDIEDPTDIDNGGAGDGMGDNWETFYFGDTETADPNADEEPDGLTNLREWQNLTDPFAMDTDGDELNDGPEVDTHGTNPTLRDTDSDGYNDLFEVTNQVAFGFDPVVDDSMEDPDSDGLNNAEELVHNTSAIDEDSDDDTINDGDEVNGVFNPYVNDVLDVAPGDATDPNNPDSDNDGINDFVELDSANGFVTNPNQADTDGDTYSDLEELTNNSNPLSPGDIPMAPVGLISVDIQGDPAGAAFTTVPALMSGFEPNFGVTSGTWNAFNIPGHPQATLDPSISLVDAAGNSTGITFSLFGTISAWSNAPGTNPLANDYLFLNAGNAGASATWELSGLSAGATYSFYPYGGIARDVLLTVDTNGDGNLADETPTLVDRNGVNFTVTAGSNGKITGSADAGSFASGEANWSGFQLLLTSAIVDTDGDGLSDLLEEDFGTDPNNPDTDGDGQSDGAEVNSAGTDPTNAASVFKIISIDYPLNADVTLTWNSVPGKAYLVEFSTDLKTWTEIVGLGPISAAASPATTTSQDVDIPETGETTKHYRVLVD